VKTIKIAILANNLSWARAIADTPIDSTVQVVVNIINNSNLDLESIAQNNVVFIAQDFANIPNCGIETSRKLQKMYPEIIRVPYCDNGRISKEHIDSGSLIKPHIFSRETHLYLPSLGWSNLINVTKIAIDNSSLKERVNDSIGEMTIE
jgi:hypothetical protein